MRKRLNEGMAADKRAIAKEESSLTDLRRQQAKIAEKIASGERKLVELRDDLNQIEARVKAKGDALERASEFLKQQIELDLERLAGA